MSDSHCFAASSLLAPQELQVHRTWEPAQRPQWLVFEVEGRLQVRPAQAAIVQHLLGHPGAIAQLNMGEGKTRVILPLLAMCLAADRKSIVSGSRVAVCQRRLACPRHSVVLLPRQEQPILYRCYGAACRMLLASSACPPAETGQQA